MNDMQWYFKINLYLSASLNITEQKSPSSVNTLQHKKCSNIYCLQTLLNYCCLSMSLQTKQENVVFDKIIIQAPLKVN